MESSGHARKARRKLIPDEIEERWAVVQGHRMRYLFGGSGPALLLIPGLMGFSFSWSENLPEMSKHFTVFAPDLLNTGYSDRADLPADLRSSALQVRDFMDGVDVQQADVIGSSYGGTIAMALAAIDPQRVRQLMLVSPSHCDSEKERWQVAVFSTYMGGRLAPLMHYAPDAVDGWFIRRMYGDDSRMLPSAIAEYARPIRDLQTLHWLVKVMKSWKHNFEQLRELMPTLQKREIYLIWGDKDRVVPLATSSALQQWLPNSRMTIIETTGHLPYEELPNQFNAAVLQLLLGHVTESAGMASAPRSL